MSLSVASSIASAAIRANSAAAATVAENIANAATEGYTVKTANRSTTDTAVGYSSVTISSVTSSVDQLTLKALIAANADLGAADATSSYLDTYQQSIGTVDDSNGIDDQINDLADSIASLATDPSSDSNKTTVIEDLESLAESLRSTSSTIQETRAAADKDIASTVDEVNDLLNQITEINDAIVSGTAQGSDTATLEDQRATLLNSLSSDIGIRYQVDDTGAVRVWTSSGTALVDAANNAHTLSHTAAATVSADTEYSSTGTSGFDGITVGGVDITTSITSGKLGALVELRDETLPDQQERLDNLATTLIDKVNDITNEGTAYPPSSSLTGTTSVSATDAISGTGTSYIALLNSDGTSTGSVVEIDWSTISTVQDLMDTINASGTVTASLSSDGKLTIASASSSTGIGLVDASGASVGSSGEGISAYFGMNDVLTGTGADDIKVSTTYTDDPSLLPSSALDADAVAASPTSGTRLLSTSEGSVASALNTLFTGSVSFSAAGGMSARTESLSDYAGDFLSGAATLADTASDALEDQETYYDNLESTMSSQSGVNTDEETMKLSDIQSAYEAAAAVLQTLQDMFDTALSTVDS